MVRGGRSSVGGAAAAVAAVGAALAMGARSVAAADCNPMDLQAMNVSDYIRWSSTSNRLYLENGACVTLTDIYESRLDKEGNKGPLYPFDETTKEKTDTVTGSWYLEADLYISDGSKLVVQGSQKGGDCDHLLLASAPGGGGTNNTFINVRAYGGDLLFDGTHVESWDMEAGSVHEDYVGGRSYISAISEVIYDEGVTCLERAKSNMGESRLDIYDTEINHLGWDDSESYGLVYKVRGFCKDLSNPEIFDQVSVTGDILRSNIHDLYFGHYSYGHQGGVWSYNEVHHNIGYGFDPHDDSDDLIIHNNHVHNNGWHGIIASKRCDNVSIQNNHVHHNGIIEESGQRIGNGIMLHRSSDKGIVRNNTVHDNMDSGVALFESFECTVSENKIYSNMNGIRLSLGSADNLIHDNEIMIHGPDSKYAIYFYQGSDTPMEGSDGRPRGNQFFDNSIISDNEVMKMGNSDNNVFEGNVIYGRFSRFKDSFNTLWRNNFVVDDMHHARMEDGSCFDPASDHPVPEYYGEEEAQDEHMSFSYNFDYGDGFFCNSGGRRV